MGFCVITKDASGAGCGQPARCHYSHNFILHALRDLKHALLQMTTGLAVEPAKPSRARKHLSAVFPCYVGNGAAEACLLRRNTIPDPCNLVVISILGGKAKASLGLVLIHLA